MKNKLIKYLYIMSSVFFCHCYFQCYYFSSAYFAINYNKICYSLTIKLYFTLFILLYLFSCFYYFIYVLAFYLFSFVKSSDHIRLVHDFRKQKGVSGLKSPTSSSAGKWDQLYFFFFSFFGFCFP